MCLFIINSSYFQEHSGCSIPVWTLLSHVFRNHHLDSFCMKLSDFEDRKEILGTGNRFWGQERISHFAYLCCPYLLQKSKEIWKEFLCPSGGSNPGLTGEKPRRYHWAILHCWKCEEILVNIYYTCCPGMIDQRDVGTSERFLLSANLPWFLQNRFSEFLARDHITFSCSSNV